MRRPILAVLVAVLGVVTLAAPAAAGGTTDIVVGHHDGSFVVESVPAATVGTALARAEQRPEVAWAEVDRTFQIAASVTPDDPRYGEQWGPVRVRAPEAWARTTGDASIVVAVVDTGVDANHPDLAGAVLPGREFVGDGLSGDPNGHGTGVAGVLAARGNNGTGIAGYCWSCSILPVRVLDAQGSGTSSGIAAGINWAANQDVDIINLSLSGSGSSQALDTAIAAARSKGILVVAAAGNQSSSGDVLTTPQYPAATPGVIGVVGTTASDSIYPWSFRGTWADVAAPGCVVTTKVGGSYSGACGTSFAAPAVSGMLALALARHPDATASALESVLRSTTAPIASGLAAHGRVDAAAFLEAVAASFPGTLVPERVAGADRIATSVALSARAFPTAESVVVARADQYLDALLAAPLAGSLEAPILLSDASGLTPGAAAEVRRLGATTAYVMGTAGVLGAGVETGLRNAGVATVERIAGSTPAAMARLVAGRLDSPSAFVVQSGAWPDAVSVSGFAAMTGSPILVVGRDAVPADTSAALTEGGITDVRIVGGASVVSTTVEAALATDGRRVTRLAGTDRYRTSVTVATASVAAGAAPERTWLVTGRNWPDALAAGPAVGIQGATLLLVDGTDAAASPSAASWLQALPGLVELVIVGGEAAITTPTLTSLSALLL